jgi:hypothetical protein
VHDVDELLFGADRSQAHAAVSDQASTMALKHERTLELCIQFRCLTSAVSLLKQSFGIP